MVFPRRLTVNGDFKKFLVPSLSIKVNSVVSGFNISILFPIHMWMAARQYANSVMFELKFLESSSK